MRHLESLRNLEVLELENCKLVGSDLMLFASFEKLRDLSVTSLVPAILASFCDALRRSRPDLNVHLAGFTTYTGL